MRYWRLGQRKEIPLCGAAILLFLIAPGMARAGGWGGGGGGGAMNWVNLGLSIARTAQHARSGTGRRIGQHAAQNVARNLSDKRQEPRRIPVFVEPDPGFNDRIRGGGESAAIPVTQRLIPSIIPGGPTPAEPDKANENGVTPEEQERKRVEQAQKIADYNRQQDKLKQAEFDRRQREEFDLHTAQQAQLLRIKQRLEDAVEVYNAATNPHAGAKTIHKTANSPQGQQVQQRIQARITQGLRDLDRSFQQQHAKVKHEEQQRHRDTVQRQIDQTWGEAVGNKAQAMNLKSQIDLVKNQLATHRFSYLEQMNPSVQQAAGARAKQEYDQLQRNLNSAEQQYLKLQQRNQQLKQQITQLRESL